MEFALPVWLDACVTPLRPWLPLMTGLGVLMALVSMLAIPWMLVRLPRDYFNAPTRTNQWRGPMAWLISGGRNLLALVMLIAGIAMLVLPGQGLLTILIALMVSTFPGKYRIERAIMRRHSVLRAVNWIRRRSGKPPLDSPLHHHGDHVDAD